MCFEITVGIKSRLSLRYAIINEKGWTRCIKNRMEKRNSICKSMDKFICINALTFFTNFIERKSKININNNHKKNASISCVGLILSTLCNRNIKT